MSNRAARTAARPQAAEPATPLPSAPAALAVGQSAAAVLGGERRLAGGADQLLHLRQLPTPERHQAILGMQRTIGNHAVQRLIQARPLAVHRQPGPGQPPSSGGTHTITDREAAIRGGPDDFKPTGKNLAVGTRVEVIDTQTSAKGAKGTYVNLVEHGTGTPLGWTAQTNLGDVQYAKAAASFVYVAKVKPRPSQGLSDSLPVMVYVPPNFGGKKKTDVVLYFHGDAADYSAGEANNYGRENPAIGMHLTGGAAGADRIVIAPQANEWTAGGTAIHKKSPWGTLHAGDYESIVQTVLTNLQGDLKLQAAIPRGSFSLAGHSGGGKALGQAAQDLDPTGGGVKDVTLVDAGYGGGEDTKGKSDGGAFAKSFQMVRDWLLEGKPGKVLRVITKAGTPGDDTRSAIENLKGAGAGRVPVLGLDGVRNAIKAKGRDAELHAVATEVTTDPQKRTGGMKLIRKIVVSKKDGSATQGTIYVFLMTNPPRAAGVDTHFGTRNATIGDIASGTGKGDNFATP